MILPLLQIVSRFDFSRYKLQCSAKMSYISSNWLRDLAITPHSFLVVFSCFSFVVVFFWFALTFWLSPLYHVVFSFSYSWLLRSGWRDLANWSSYTYFVSFISSNIFAVKLLPPLIMLKKALATAFKKIGI